MAGLISLGQIQAELTTKGFGQFSTDLKKADGQLSDFSKILDKVGDKFIKVGKQLNTKLTLPIIAAGGAALKLAGDFEVASRKFSKAFEGAGDQANAAVTDLNANFGLATSQATQLLAFTGDLLKGFGATSEQALDLSTSVQKLATALSAYNGVPIDQASKAATAALLGETEQLKQLGIVIRQSDIEQQLLLDGTSELTGQALLLAKAQATLKLAYQQSGDAVNSFAENTDTLNFQTQALFGDIKDLGVELGTVLIPIAKEIIGQVKDWVAGFKELDDEAKKNILVAAGFAAALGPVITAIGVTIKAVAGLQAALTFLAANPIVAAIAGVAALTTAVVALVKIGQDRKIDALSEQFGELAAATGVADEDMKQFLQTAELVEGIFVRNQWSTSMEEIAGQIEQLSSNLGLTREQVIEIIKQSESLTDEFKAMVDEIEKQYQVYQDLSGESLRQERNSIGVRDIQERQAEISAERLRSEQETTAELQAQADIEQARLRALITDRTQAEAAYNKQLNDAQDRYNLRLIDSLELEELRLEASKQYADELIKLGYNGQDSTQLGNIALREQADLIQELTLRVEDANVAQTDYMIGLAEYTRRVIQELKDAGEWVDGMELFDIEREYGLILAQEERIALEEQWRNTLEESTKTQLDFLQEEYDAAIEQAENLGADTAAIHEYYGKLITEEEERQAEISKNIQKEKWDNIVSVVGDAASTWMSILKDINSQQISLIDSEYQAKIDALDKEILGEEAYKKQVEELEEEAALKKWEIDKKQFKQDQLSSVGRVIMNTAGAIMKAFEQLGPIGGSIAATLLGVMGGVQIGVIASQQPPPRPFATGGVVNNPGDGINAIIGEAGPEAVLPLTDETFNALGTSIVEAQQATASNSANTGGLQQLVVIIEGLGQANIPITQAALNNGKIRIPSRAITGGV